jgi:hypothetical protein
MYWKIVKMRERGEKENVGKITIRRVERDWRESLEMMSQGFLLNKSGLFSTVKAVYKLPRGTEKLKLIESESL